MDLVDKTMLQAQNSDHGPEPLSVRNFGLPSHFCGPNTFSFSSLSLIPNSKQSPILIQDGTTATNHPRRRGGRLAGAKNKITKEGYSDKGKEVISSATDETMEELTIDKKKRKIMEIVAMDCSMLPAVPEAHSTTHTHLPPPSLRTETTDPDPHTLDLILQLLNRPSVVNHLVKRGLLSPNILNFMSQPKPATEMHYPNYPFSSLTTSTLNGSNAPIRLENVVDQNIHLELVTEADKLVTVDNFGTEEARVCWYSECESHQQQSPLNLFFDIFN